MATKLEKDITRETTTPIGDRLIMATITKDQKISLKLKGMKSGELSISIEDLYKQLTGDGPTEKKPIKSRTTKLDTDEIPLINMYDFRSAYLINPDISVTVKGKLESITVRLIKELKAALKRK